MIIQFGNGKPRATVLCCWLRRLVAGGYSSCWVRASEIDFFPLLLCRASRLARALFQTAFSLASVPLYKLLPSSVTCRCVSLATFYCLSPLGSKCGEHSIFSAILSPDACHLEQLSILWTPNVCKYFFIIMSIIVWIYLMRFDHFNPYHTKYMRDQCWFLLLQLNAFLCDVVEKVIAGGEIRQTCGNGGIAIRKPWNNFSIQ